MAVGGAPCTEQGFKCQTAGMVHDSGAAPDRDRAAAARHEMRGGRAASSVLQLYGEVPHETQQGSASDDTNSRKWRQVAGIRLCSGPRWIRRVLIRAQE